MYAPTLTALDYHPAEAVAVYPYARFHRAPRLAVMLLSDVGASCVSVALASGMAGMLLGEGHVSAPGPGALWALLLMSLMVFAALRLYTTVPLRPVEELRAFGIGTTLTYFLLAQLWWTLQGSADEVLLILGLAWLCALLLLPCSRALARKLFAARPWWTSPTVVLGSGTEADRVVRMLLHHPELGLRPVAVLSDTARRGDTLGGVPVLGGWALAPSLARDAGVPCAVVVRPDRAQRDLQQLIEQEGRFFRHMLVLPEHAGLASPWVHARDLNGLLSFEVQPRLLRPWRQRCKRCVDLLAALAGLLLFLPLALLVALLIRLDSPGPALFVQYRLGRDGRCFRMIKFRTMYQNAGALLAQRLREDPQARAEYAAYQKLQDDPRVTRVGRWLRKLSIDEWPQFINVLRGEMSLIGPRPYLPSELEQMQKKDRLILRALPGITGSWQVAGRSMLTFENRLDLDVDYIRNWSVSLDLYLLARTLPAVLSKKGAY